jgi:hypothetical protein
VLKLYSVVSAPSGVILKIVPQLVWQSAPFPAEVPRPAKVPVRSLRQASKRIRSVGDNKIRQCAYGLRRSGRCADTKHKT